MPLDRCLQLFDHALYPCDISILPLDENAEQRVVRAHHGEEALDLRHLQVATFKFGDHAIDLVQVEAGW